MRVLQVCNVGQILGGTAACAWSVVQSLPGCEHVVAFMSQPTDETRRAFGGCEIAHWDRVTRARVRDAQADVVILHNTSAGRVEQGLDAVVLAGIEGDAMERLIVPELGHLAAEAIKTR